MTTTTAITRPGPSRAEEANPREPTDGVTIANRALGLVPVVAAAAFVGAIAPLLPTAGLFLLAGAVAACLVAVLIGFHARAREGHAWHPVVMVLTGLAVLTVTWNSVPLPVAQTNVADLVLFAA